MVNKKDTLGIYQVLFEEAYHTLAINKPIYILGGFGGAAKSLVQSILGEQPMQLTNDFQYNSDFLKMFMLNYQGKSASPVDFNEVTAFFREHTIGHLSALNGLTDEENKILFESTNIHELVYLIIKGLKNIFNKK